MPTTGPSRLFADPRWTSVFARAAEQGGVMARAQLIAAGVARWEITSHLRARRWRLHDKRRLLLHAVVNDLLDGARSLGEIDVGRELARRGLPPPTRQVLRKDRRGRYYLDLYWPDLGVVVEIDGIHHAWAENIVGDALRQNALVLESDVVLRLPLLGLRLQPDEFFQQIADALARGRRRAA
ncbi:hypothetical protein [Nocardioides bizhenqiangii]|uniref:DUF559 domain-containing protein n=1 Tax=Nocardioides bizhenqiangii TaxID=3095076 RepID=A0ABZ0ZPR9_9ACTN|nr:hypothetical protein [Nocardioides sp. HM61]WQQ25819.1 hypothetical protein SHK19_17855 [Nocardioides sp. HM61]